jgi:manganese efflux pump family protein
MIEALILALALAMDAFAVALTQGARFRPGWRGGGALD